MMINNIPQVSPQQIQGTIKISSGEIITINSHAVKNNESNKSSESFVKKLKKAIAEDLFKKEDGSKNK